MKEQLAVPLPGVERTNYKIIAKQYDAYMRLARTTYLGDDYENAGEKSQELIANGLAPSFEQWLNEWRVAESLKSAAQLQRLALPAEVRVRTYALGELNLLLRAVALQKVVAEEDEAELEAELLELERYERMRKLNAGAFG